MSSRKKERKERAGAPLVELESCAGGQGGRSNTVGKL